MASSLLDLDDLIEFQLERIKFEELNYKDELQLQRQLLDLDVLQCSQRRLKHTLAKTLTNQQHQALQVPEALSCSDLPCTSHEVVITNPNATADNNLEAPESSPQNKNHSSSSSTGAIARTSLSSSRRQKASAIVGGSVQNITNGSIEIAMEDLGAGAYGGGGTGGGIGGGSVNGGAGVGGIETLGVNVLRANTSLPSFSDSEEEAFNIDHQKEFR